MKILELYAEEFGCFVERRFSFSEGVTLIEGDNESGKSTLQALFRFLFYGFPRRAGVDAEERDKRLSHKGRRAAGAVRFAYEGEEYFLRRQVILRGSAKRELVSEEVSVTRLSDGSSVDLGERSAGEYFLGMPWELYQSSFCARQTELASVSAPEAGGALGDFLFQGDESARIDKARDALIKARRELRYQRGRGGLIAELEDELVLVKKTVADAAAGAVALHEKRAAMTKYARVEAELSHEIEEIKKKISSAEADEMIARFDAWHTAQGEEDEARRVLAESDDVTESENSACEAFFATVHGDIDACERAVGLCSLQESELSRAQRSLLSIPMPEKSEEIELAGGTIGVKKKCAEFDRRARVFATSGGVFAAAVVAFLVLAALLVPFLFAAVALFAGLSIGFFVSVASTRKKRQAFLSSLGIGEASALELVLDRYERGVEARAALSFELDDRTRSVNEAKNACALAEQALFAHMKEMGLPCPAGFAEAKRTVTILEAKWRNGIDLNAKKRNDLENAITKRKAYESGLDVENEDKWRALRATLPHAEKDRATLVRELEFKQGAYENVAKAYANVKTEVAVMSASAPDVAVLRTREREIERDLAAARLRYAAVTLAEEALAEAGTQMKESVVPRVARVASSLFSKMIGEQDRTLLLENDFSVKVMTGEGVYPLSHFSVGCRDAALLSIRLALSEAVSEAPLPLLFDEVTAHLDDTRATRFLHTLCEYCTGERQGILFTCHRREAALLEGREYHRILL